MSSASTAGGVGGGVRASGSRLDQARPGSRPGQMGRCMPGASTAGAGRQRGVPSSGLSPALDRAAAVVHAHAPRRPAAPSLHPAHPPPGRSGPARRWSRRRGSPAWSGPCGPAQGGTWRAKARAVARRAQPRRLRTPGPRHSQHFQPSAPPPGLPAGPPRAPPWGTGWARRSAGSRRCGPGRSRRPPGGWGRAGARWGRSEGEGEAEGGHGWRGQGCPRPAHAPHGNLVPAASSWPASRTTPHPPPLARAPAPPSSARAPAPRAPAARAASSRAAQRWRASPLRPVGKRECWPSLRCLPPETASTDRQRSCSTALSSVEGRSPEACALQLHIKNDGRRQRGSARAAAALARPRRAPCSCRLNKPTRAQQAPPPGCSHSPEACTL